MTMWMQSHKGLIMKVVSGIPAVERKPFKNNHLNAASSARGGLEPHFRVLFSAIFHGISPGISIRVENCGK